MVRTEVRGSSMIRIRFRTAVESGKLKVRAPKKSFIDKVKASARLVGDSFFLSEADLQVLALALELRAMDLAPSIATDDYSIQNVANQMGIEFASLITLGIRFRLQWLRYCPACHKRYPANYKSKRCEICGTELKRKPLRKKLLKRY